MENLPFLFHMYEWTILKNNTKYYLFVYLKKLYPLLPPQSSQNDFQTEIKIYKKENNQLMIRSKIMQLCSYGVLLKLYLNNQQPGKKKKKSAGTEK